MGALAAPSWPSGADGALSINGTVTTLLAGSIKDYSSISIINNGELRIYSDLTISNGGNVPTIIGCSGNCTINTGGKITATRNAMPINTSTVQNYTYSENLPDGAPLASVSYTVAIGEGGTGGDSGNPTYFGGVSGASGWGHGGGAAGAEDGYSPTTGSGWGVSGDGGYELVNMTPTSGVNPYLNGFGAPGNVGEYSFEGDDFFNVYGGGGSGGVRGYNGGCFALIVAGTLSVSGVVFDVSGSEGGPGGVGGDAEAMVGEAIGGGGGGAGAGGNAGKVYIRYKSGSASAANCNLAGGTNGVGGLGGTGFGSPLPGGDINGFAGANGESGNIGTSDIASYS